jgi:hypothetical protein
MTESMQFKDITLITSATVITMIVLMLPLENLLPQKNFRNVASLLLLKLPLLR